MENTNLSDKSREALNSETFQKIREDMKNEIVKEYLKNGYVDEEKQHEITVTGVKYNVLEREKFTTFYDSLGNTLFNVRNEDLAALSEINCGEMKDAGSGLEPEEIKDASVEESADPAETGENPDGGAAPARCITGKSKSGICGAAAYCAKGVKCCSECSNPCNSCCGWLDAQEESSADKTSDVTEKTEEDFKEKAQGKLHDELKNADDKQFADPIIGHLLKRCEEDDGLAQDVMQEHKTWEKCYEYIFKQAQKQAKNARSAAVRYDVVYEWAEDYYHRDDKAEEEKKAKKEVERKKKSAEKKKQDTEKKGKATSVKPPKSGKAEEKKTAVSEPKREVQKPKSKKNELDGQIDFFSMMGM